MGDIKHAFWTKVIKHTTLIVLANILLGVWIGGFLERNRFYNDCRYAGVTRIGEAAFKCEQFSKVVLLTPDEQAKKQEKK